MNIFKILSTIAAVTALAACGGGGGGDTSSAPTAATFDPTVFQGTYTASDTACKSFAYGNNQYSKRTTLTIDSTTVVGRRDIYSDAACTTQIGTLTITDNISFSASTLEGGNTNIANLKYAFSGFKLSSVNPSSPVVMTSLPGPDKNDKTIIKLVGSALYGAASSSPVDANGYPTTFNTTKLGTKQ
jgi:hypothetical protein